MTFRSGGSQPRLSAVGFRSFSLLGGCRDEAKFFESLEAIAQFNYSLIRVTRKVSQKQITFGFLTR